MSAPFFRSAHSFHSLAPASGAESLHLSEFQKMVAIRLQPPAMTIRECLGRVQTTLMEAQAALDQGMVVNAQTLLEDTHLQLLAALNAFHIQPEAGLVRAWSRLQHKGEKRAFHIFDDRVEIRVGNETRGGWPLYSEHDYRAALKLAQELDCRIIHEEVRQMSLFNPSVS